LTHAGAHVTAYSEVTEKPNLGMAVIADDRLERLAETIGSKKVTPAAIRIVDVPGRAEIPGELRQADALLAVLDGFSDGADPGADLETLRLELVVADLVPLRRLLVDDLVRRDSELSIRDATRRRLTADHERGPVCLELDLALGGEARAEKS